MIQDLGTCDYLVIGSGAASMAFIDTLLTELPESKIILVDKHHSPGGHWNDAYSFVHLHQPSVVYGVQSKQLEGNWAASFLTFNLPWRHRASKEEILHYYQEVLGQWEKSGQVSFYGNCEYDFGQQEHSLKSGIHHFQTIGGENKYVVHVDVKFVNGVLGECQVPSKCPLEFPVDGAVQVVTPNQLAAEPRDWGGMGLCCTGEEGARAESEAKAKKYIVVGAGKTGMDCVVYLQTAMGVSPDLITWIISADVWMVNRALQDPDAFSSALVRCGGDVDKACDDLEAKEIFIRLDPDVRPTRYRFPFVGPDEIELMRNVKNTVRRGRISSISCDAGKKAIAVSFGEGKEPLILPHSKDYSHGPYNGLAETDIFASEKELNLIMVNLPPVTISMSITAKLESARRKGTLALGFGKSVAHAVGSEETPLSENEVLRTLVKGYQPNKGDDTRPLRTLAVFIALLNEDPAHAVEWLKGNRLSMLSVPGQKVGIYELVSTMIEKRDEIGLAENSFKMLPLLKEKLKPLEGK